jgi:D-amino-acid oxidase
MSTEEATQDPCWKDIVFGFRVLTSKEIKEMSAHHQRNYLSGCHFVTFCCEPIKLIPYLSKRFVSAGGRFETRKVRDFDELKGADLIVNCTGLGGKELGDDKLHPIRGQITRVNARWMYFVIIDDSDDGNYIIPNAETVKLGGTHQVSDFNTKVSTSDKDFIMNGCNRLVPSLVNAEWLRDVVGLRPGRHSVRLETEKRDGGRTTVIHNVG